MPALRRTGLDGCPGALQVHAAADGGLARIRVPGGWLTAAQWAVLHTASAELGEGRLELTSRGNVQIRALAPGAELELAHRLADAGLLPSQTHERIRNVVASPLSGRNGRFDVRPWVHALDDQLCADAQLAALPGRFLFGLDDGQGDVLGLDADLAACVIAPDEVALVLGGLDVGLRVRPADVVTALLAVARGFVAGGDAAWRLAELDVVEFTSGLDLPMAWRDGPQAAVGRPPPVGPVDQADGRIALVVAAPLGRLTAEQAAFLGEVGPAGQLAVTPWRAVVVPDLPRADIPGVAAELDLAGLVLDPGSPWVGVSACTGTPGCAKSRADVQADAARFIGMPGLPVHWAGCERRCGHPAGRHVDVLAVDGGYQVDGLIPDELGSAVAGARRCA
jgi:precorrin-3B synthase